jgi:putative phosphotransacetylase
MKTQILVETSARHVHLTDEAVEILFGKGAKLSHKKDLSQHGQFATNERLTLVGPKRSIENVLVLGPTRSAIQAEVSFTDARNLGINPPVRQSGDTKGSAPIKIVGPCGEIESPEGAIIAQRHVHVTAEEAAEYGIHDNQVVKIKIDSERSLVFDNVVVRIHPTFSAAVHLDTDEANAASAFGECFGTIIQ